MTIHVVKHGETIQSIADQYGVSVERLILDNDIKNPDRLVIGQNIVILFPRQTHTVQEGDTLNGIANEFGINIMELLRNNPFLADREFIYPGEELVISYSDEKIMEATVNGYTYPFIDPLILRKTLPYLTYITIFNYMVTAEGDLIDIDDMEIIQTAKSYGVAPIMLISTLTAYGQYDPAIMNTILNNVEIQDRIIENTLEVMQRKGYHGLTVDFPYISPNDRQAYVVFIEKLTKRLNEEGFFVNITLSPSTFEVETGIVYRGLDYSHISAVTNRTILLSYEWGYTYGTPVTLMAFHLIRDLLDFVVTQIDPEKSSVGIPSVGYRWQLPYVEGTRASSVSFTSAMEIAEQVGAIIHYDKNSETAYFQYMDNNQEYFVRFKDATSINVRLDLVPTYGFTGFAIWNIVYYFTQLWLMINNKFYIKKVLEPNF